MTSATANFILVPAMCAAAASCLWAARAAFYWRGRARPGEVIIWAGFATLFAAFTAARTTGLAAAVEDAARNTLRHDGWYNDRRTLQIAAVAAALLVLAVALFQIRQITTRWRRYRWTILGTAILLAFGLIRAISLHEIDAWGSSLKVLVEVPACGVAAAGALSRVRSLSAPGGDS